MRAMIGKEWRETAPWAMMALVGLGLTAVYALSQGQRQVGGDPWVGAWQVWLTVGAPLVAAALGLLQILKEQRRDQWAFLVHRPVPRGTLFWGKVVAGLSLYLFAVGVPFGLTHLWAALPGNVAAPYDARLMLPGLADILGGSVFYFAGMLTALRPARWYGSRALPLPAALVSAGLVTVVPEFRHALLVITLFAAVFAVAAWGSFLTSGDYAPQPKVARFALATTLLLGLAVSVAGAFALVAAFGGSVSRSHVYTDYALTRQGRLARVTTDNGTILRATDLEGHLITGLAKTGYPGDGENFLRMTALLQQWRRPEGAVSYRDFRRFFTPLPSTPDMAWYFSNADRRALGYSLLHNPHRLAARLGKTGFAPASAPLPPAFEGPLRTSSLSPYFAYGSGREQVLVFDRSVFWLNVNDRRLTRLASVPPPQRIAGVAAFQSSTAPGAADPTTTLVIATPSEFRSVAPDGKRLLRTPRLFDPRAYPNVEVAQTPTGGLLFFWYNPRYPLPGEPDKKLPSYVSRVARDGAVQETLTLPRLPEPPNQASSTAPLGLILPPGAFAVGGIYLLAAHQLDRRGDTSLWVHFFLGEVRLLLPALWVSLFIGLACAAGAVAVGRRCGWGRTAQIRWAVGVFLLGAFGLLLLLALDEWPAREPCPHCGRKRVVTRERCEHCGAPFSLLAPDGTEIFDTPSPRETVVA